MLGMLVGSDVGYKVGYSVLMMENSNMSDQ